MDGVISRVFTYRQVAHYNFRILLGRQSSRCQRVRTEMAREREHCGHINFVHMVRVISRPQLTSAESRSRTWIPSATALTSFFCYTLIAKERLTVSKAFTSIALFSQLQEPMTALPGQFFAMLHGKLTYGILTFLLTFRSVRFNAAYRGIPS